MEASERKAGAQPAGSYTRQPAPDERFHPCPAGRHWGPNGAAGVLPWTVTPDGRVCRYGSRVGLASERLAGVPEEPVTFDELEQLLLRLPGNPVEALEQQILSRLKEQTLVGGKRVTRQELPELPKDAVTTVHRVKVSLYGAKPPVWRRLEIPSAMPLNLVHAVLQIAFDWHDYHLHAFETVCGQFGSPDQDDDWAERQDEATATLAQVAGAERAKVVYSYDFGDDWRHDIVVEKIIPAEPGVAYPRCTGGRRDGPPEDCGGIWVFNEQFADLGDLFNVGDLNERLADLATVLIPAR